jgi:hypothetical protein
LQFAICYQQESIRIYSSQVIGKPQKGQTNLLLLA